MYGNFDVNLLSGSTLGIKDKKINQIVDCRINVIEVLVPIETIYESPNLSKPVIFPKHFKSA